LSGAAGRRRASAGVGLRQHQRCHEGRHRGDAKKFFLVHMIFPSPFEFPSVSIISWQTDRLSGSKFSLANPHIFCPSAGAASGVSPYPVSFKAFLFDLDGTLVDSNELHVESWDRAFRHFGKEFSRAELRQQIGKGSDQYLPEFLSPEEIERFGKELDEYRSELFRREYLPRVQPFPKVRELFACIRNDGKQIVLATSGKNSEAKYYTKLLQIDELIDGQTTADDADRSKPAPDIFPAALAKIDNVSETEALVVGDTRFDLEAAAKAGLSAIAFLCGGTDEAVLRRAGALAIYRNPADLLLHYSELPRT
jgi:HAD superfamily hydrolase (TIGR01549 family)